MMRRPGAIIGRPRAVLSISAVLALAGLVFCFAARREASPDIALPVFAITIAQEGISVEDAERLLIRPVEGSLRGLAGLKELTAVAAPGRASLVAELDLHADRHEALAALREKIAAARSELPAAADEPVVEETDPGFHLPVITVALSGAVPERTLQRFARKLKDRVETLPNVLKADIAGSRPEVLEVIIDPAKLQSYAVGEAELTALAARNNRLVTAGQLDTGGGQVSLKAPGLFESDKDVLSLPVKVSTQGLVTLRDVGELRRTFKDATGFARVNGQPALILRILKRPGANTLETARAVRQAVEAATREWPEPIKTDILLDQSRPAAEMLGSLGGALVSALLLVMAATVLTLGLRASLPVALTMALSFLAGFAGLALAGVTLNPMVMFGLVLSVGLLADGAIILVDCAARDMARGVSAADAYRRAAAQMLWPVIMTRAAVCAAFVPMLFWPGIAGKFMNALPVTVICMLGACVFTVLVVLPALLGALGAGKPARRTAGADYGRGQNAAALRGPSMPVAAALGQAPRGPAAPLTPIAGPIGPPSPGAFSTPMASEGGSPSWLGRMFGAPTGSHPDAALSRIATLYAALLPRAIRRPVTVLGLTAALIITVLAASSLFGEGTEFFVDTVPEAAIVSIAGRGNLSAREELELVKSVEAALLQIGGARTLLTVSGSAVPSGPVGNDRADQIGQITIAFEDDGKRLETRKLLREIRLRTAELPGVQVEVRKAETGLPAGKPLRLEVASADRETAIAAAAVIRRHLDEDRQLRDIEDTRPLPGIEWTLTVDREEAGRFGADTGSLGAAIQMITSGVLLGKYLPPDAEGDIDIRARFPIDERSVGQLDQLTVRTAAGIVPISNFVERKAQPQTGEHVRKNRLYAVTIAANTVDGVRGDTKRAETVKWLKQQEWPEGIGFRFRGAGQDEREASTFLKQAMLAALFAIFVMLVARYDSFYQTAVVLAMVPLSLVGVLAGMLATGQSFSVVMSGAAILALTGLAVGNAMLLVDTYNLQGKAGADTVNAVMRASLERLRPMLLTTLVTIIGLLPLALGCNLNLLDFSLEIGSAASVWWGQFAVALIFGLAVSTGLTLVLVPTLLAAPETLAARWRHWKVDTLRQFLAQHKAASLASRLLKLPEGRE